MQQAPVQIKAALLGMVFLASMTLKTGHLLLLHHEHHDVPVCEVGHDDSSVHLHDERYNPDDCATCAFLFAVPELVSVHVSLQAFSPLSENAPATPCAIVPLSALHTIRLRGPPSTPMC